MKTQLKKEEFVESRFLLRVSRVRCRLCAGGNSTRNKLVKSFMQTEQTHTTKEKAQNMHTLNILITQ